MGPKGPKGPMGEWRPIGSDDVATRLDWSAASRLSRCDPYLIWADLSARVSRTSASRISLLVEVAHDFDWDHEGTPGVTQMPWLANRLPNQPTIVPAS